MSKRPVANTARQLALNDPDELAVFAQLLWDAASVAGTMGVPPPWQDKVKEIVNAVMRDEYRDAVRRDTARAGGNPCGRSARGNCTKKERIDNRGAAV
jgi:hypothetical protein